MSKKTAMQEMLNYIETEFAWFLEHSPAHGVVPQMKAKATELLELEREQKEEYLKENIEKLIKEIKSVNGWGSHYMLPISFAQNIINSLSTTYTKQ